MFWLREPSRTMPMTLSMGFFFARLRFGDDDLF